MNLISKLLLAFIITALISGSARVSSAQAPPAAPVMVEKVAEKTVQKPVVLVGAAEPVKSSIVASEIAGLVESYPVQEGDYVKAGDVLAKFNTRQTEISLSEAKASRNEAGARYKLSRQDLERFSRLREKGVASVQQYQDAEAEKEAWAARISQSKAQVEGYQYDLDKSTIRAPFSGYVTAEHTEVGEWVERGGPVVEMIDIGTMEIKFDMPERYINGIKKGDEVSVKFDALPGAAFNGVIVAVVPQADSQTRTFTVRVNIDNKEGALKSGMVGRASFPVGEPSTVIMVHKDAIV